MDLWIRSQDKEILCSVKEVSLSGEDDTIICARGVGVFYIIGKYETRQRALEIIDDIQGKILPKIQTIYPNTYRGEKLNDTQFYEMPEK